MLDDENNLAKKERLEQQRTVTVQLSETTRFVAFGIVAWVFAVQTSDSDFSKSFVASYSLWTNIAGALAILSIVGDYFQYLMAYISVRHALTRKDERYQYNKNHPAYFMQLVCFIVKQAAVGVGAVIVVLSFALHTILG